MTSRKCYKKHYLNIEHISQCGRDFKFFTYIYTNFYCSECNKARRVLDIYLHKPNFLRKKKDNSDELPF